MSSFNKKLRSIIAKRCEIPDDVLDEALEAANTENKSLGEVLVAQHKLDERDFLGIIAGESGFAR